MGWLIFSLETYSVAVFWALLLGLNFGAATSAKRGSWPRAAPMATATLGVVCLSSAAFGLFLARWALRRPVLRGRRRRSRRDWTGPSDLQVASAGLGADRVTQLEKARALSWAAVRQAPCDTGAWLRLAEIDVAMTGDLGPTGVVALRNSYRVAPMDPYQAFWRTRFVLEHWAGLPLDIMNDADRESGGGRRQLAPSRKTFHDAERCRRPARSYGRCVVGRLVQSAQTEQSHRL